MIDSASKSRAPAAVHVQPHAVRPPIRAALRRGACSRRARVLDCSQGGACARPGALRRHFDVVEEQIRSVAPLHLRAELRGPPASLRHDPFRAALQVHHDDRGLVARPDGAALGGRRRAGGATYLPDGENGLESKKRWMVDWFGGVSQVGTDGAQHRPRRTAGSFGAAHCPRQQLRRGVARLSHTSCPEHRCSSLVDASLGEAARPPSPGVSESGTPRAGGARPRRRERTIGSSEGKASRPPAVRPRPRPRSVPGAECRNRSRRPTAPCGTGVERVALRPQGESRCPSCRAEPPAAPLSLDQPKNWTIDYEPFEARESSCVAGRGRASLQPDRPGPRLCLMRRRVFHAGISGRTCAACSRRRRIDGWHRGSSKEGSPGPARVHTRCARRRAAAAVAVWRCLAWLRPARAAPSAAWRT